MNKQALTDIPLSPEEKYEASKLLGRSLFSAMQLSREQEERRNRMFKLPGIEDERTLSIPVPASLMPVHTGIEPKLASKESDIVSFIEDAKGNGELVLNKGKNQSTASDNRLSGGMLTGATIGNLLASAPVTGSALGGLAGGVLSGEPAYKGLKYDKSQKKLDDSIEHLFKLQEGEGAGAHIKRNIGKYVGGAGGGLLAKAMKGKLRLLAPFAGLAIGHSFDKSQKDEATRDAYKDPKNVEDMLTDVLLRKEMREKNASDTVHGLIADALSGAKESPVRLLMGGNAGFRDARKEYYYNQRAKIQQEIAAAQKDYIDTLSKIKTGSAENYDNTPLVDAFCNGMAHYVMFGKTAALGEDVDISDGSVKRFLGDAVNQIYQHSPAKPATNFAASSLLNTAAGTAYLTYLMRKKMREEPDKYMDQHTPTKVELQPF